MDRWDSVLWEAVGWVSPVDVEGVKEVENCGLWHLRVAPSVDVSPGELLEWWPIPKLQCGKGDMDLGHQ